MRVFIISDMEGVAGITNWGGSAPATPLYEEGRTLYTEEINAAVRGARAGGATEVVVMDCHGAGGDQSFNSLRPDLLDDGCEFVVQREWTEYTGVLEDGLRRGALRRHARDGRHRGRACMSHTVSGTRLAQRALQRRARWARPGSTPRCAAPGAARCCS